MNTYKTRIMKGNQDITLHIIDYLTGEISQEGACALAQWVQES